jgi:hypothetical protein
MAKPAQITPTSDEHVLVRLADASVYDEWCTDAGVFTRGGPPLPLTPAQAARLLADAGTNLVEVSS